jgi:hypothetical protein
MDEDRIFATSFVIYDDSPLTRWERIKSRFGWHRPVLWSGSLPADESEDTINVTWKPDGYFQIGDDEA